MGEREVFLTPKEFQILQVLASHCGKTLSANEIIEAVWGEEYRDEVAIPVYVRRIRDKIEESPSEPRHLKTRWGAGYYFEGSGRSGETPRLPGFLRCGGGLGAAPPRSAFTPGPGPRSRRS